MQMNKLVTFMAVCLLSTVAFAHDGKSANEIMGPQIGAEVSGATDVSIYAKHWWKHASVDISTGFSHVEKETGNVLTFEEDKFQIGWGGSYGYAWRMLRPYVRLGMEYKNGDLNGVDSNAFIMEPSLGLEVIAGHIVLGVKILEVPYILDGEVGGVDNDGQGVEFLRSVSIAYQF